MQEYQRLINRIEDRKDERERIKRRGEEFSDHINTIKQATNSNKVGFWCNSCKRDFEGYGRKCVREAGMWPVAWYQGRCPCGKVCIRRITDKVKDLYYFRSKFVRRQRVENAYDMIDPNHPLFKVLYPKQYNKIEHDKYK